MNETADPSLQPDPTLGTSPDIARPDVPEERPLDYLVTGAALAAIALAFIAYVVYHGWFVQDISKDWAYAGIGFPYVGFICGVFLFAYGWERRDAAKALRLTFIVGVLALAAIAAAVVLLALLSKSKGSSSNTSSGDSLDASSESPSGGAGLNAVPLFRAVGSILDDEIDLGLSSAATNDAPSDGKAQPFTVRCQQCQSRFTPTPPRAVCPQCGHAALSA